MGIEFAKGHGTQNDFVVLADAEGKLELTDDRVRALCDRNRGLGADGVLRVVRSEHIADAPEGTEAEWFMDYRNADGSIAEMCGNGVRVFANYLVHKKLAEAGSFLVGTRAGDKPVIVIEEDDSVTGLDARPCKQVSVDMGPARIVGESTATVAGRAFCGIAVDVGNPHLVCVTDVEIADLDLTVPPGHDPVMFPHGVNVEFISPLSDFELRMRVHERGVGETRSCGTGTVAAVAAFLHRSGRDGGELLVNIPGGQVRVSIGEETSTLTGPAVLVAEGTLSDSWWLGG
ncbi:diaminopimelate epimerase [Allokutzneria sp. A3M-2-11 16]|uniref:diaminopimelate epimerase n=1 Tax=Allokutzneria sp. A3M-2-11 16 TaxID=2962043 RepID=UPI0020B858E6|nr:diaminopimelate epimerase [Allokutzneria sp. A3M-2-11 16]MCP3801698.1 diaminopimelate epimerase [Allokutzneria sp. A3M-2-11 16]